MIEARSTRKVSFLKPIVARTGFVPTPRTDQFGLFKWILRF